MQERKPQSHGHLAPLIYFGATACLAALMLIVTVVIWLAEAIGSARWATLIVGSFFLFVAWLIYMLAVRPALDYIRNRLDTIYDVAYAVQNGYKRAFDFLLRFLDQITRK
ncbi:MAG: hypothetical protein IJ976_01185 [Alistipes sp.]|nr:hypothetical protein [Alistipes sp.]MBR2072260.1 hypothetical protein [Alistipes sp.]MBR3775797.1 hypothetical protein [Alistipes sp.]